MTREELSRGSDPLLCDDTIVDALFRAFDFNGCATVFARFPARVASLLLRD
jgi:hypothetical protein